MKKINIQLNSKSVESAIKKMQYIKSNIALINEEFAFESLEWIKNRSNEYLESRVKNFPNTANIQNEKYWHNKQVSKKQSKVIYELRNDNELVAYVEFGTGIVGAKKPHKNAIEVGYKYDKNNRGEEGWTFYNEQINLFLKNFKGYEGKSFLYDACWDYFYQGVWKKIYKKIYDKYMGS